jgi:HEAT repeat protein
LRGVVLKALGDHSDYVVRTACEAVARWELIEAHERVVALLANASAVTRQAAIRTLDAIWLDSDFLAIFRIYTSARETGIRREAAWVLRRRAASANRRLLFDAFRKDGLPRHRQWACELAETFSAPDIVPLLLPLASDADGHVRKAALRAIRTLSSCK